MIKEKMKNISGWVLAPLVGLTMLASTSANAIPSLQLDIPNGTYVGGQDETVYASSNSFSLYAYLIPDAKAPLTDNYFLSMALVPPTSVAGPYGSFTFNSTPMSVTGSMTYGTPPLDATLALAGFDNGDLSKHSIFPTYYYQQVFNFSLGNTATPYDTIAHPGSSPDTNGSGMYFAKFDFNVSGLAAGYGIHFDLYSEKLIQKCANSPCTVTDIDANQFAPFSHDAQGMVTTIPEPETYAMLLAGLGLMGFVARRRQQVSA